MAYVSQALNRFNALVSEIEAAYHSAAQRMGVADSVQHILYVLYCQGEGVTQADICRMGGMSKQTIHSAIRTMERNGLLRLTEGCKRAIRLTDAGRALMERVARPIAEAEDSILSHWTEQERELYFDLTHRYAAAFREQIDLALMEESQ